MPHDLLNNRAAFGGQKHFMPALIAAMRLYRDEAKTRAAVPGAGADVTKVSRHRRSMYAHRAGIGIDAVAFVQRDHQENRRERQRNRATQIAERLECPQQALQGLLLSLHYR